LKLIAIVSLLLCSMGWRGDHTTNRLKRKLATEPKAAFQLYVVNVKRHFDCDGSFDAIEFIPIYGTRYLRGKEAHAMAGGQCRGLQSRPPAFLDIPSMTVDEFQCLMPSFEAAI
jgi:hypothetical protein